MGDIGGAIQCVSSAMYDPVGEGRDKGILAGRRSFNLRKGSLVHRDSDWQTPDSSVANG